MAYVDTPISTDDQDVSAPQIRGNFLQANTSFGVDHFQFSDLDANNGKHLQAHLVERLGPNIPTTAADEGAIYTKLSAIVPLQTELFWRSESSATEIQLTTGAVSATASGYTFLPGGLVMQWASFVMNVASSSQTVTFPIPFNAACLSLVITPNTNVPAINNIGFTTLTPSNFVAFRNNSTTGTGFFYIAIGN